MGSVWAWDCIWIFDNYLTQKNAKRLYSQRKNVFCTAHQGTTKGGLPTERPPFVVCEKDCSTHFRYFSFRKDKIYAQNQGIQHKRYVR